MLTKKKLTPPSPPQPHENPKNPPNRANPENPENRVNPENRANQANPENRENPDIILHKSSRHSTSIESEIRLLDVARASFNELQGDIYNFLLRRRTDLWGIGYPDREAIWQMRLDSPQYTNNYLQESAHHILAQKMKFDPWLENENPDIVANALLVLCMREQKMLTSQMQSQLRVFKETGGFTENMSVERLEARKGQAAASGAPVCPACGNPMLKRIQKRGQNQGREFWGCSDYPHCTATLNLT